MIVTTASSDDEIRDLDEDESMVIIREMTITADTPLEAIPNCRVVEFENCTIGKGATFALGKLRKLVQLRFEDCDFKIGAFEKTLNGEITSKSTSFIDCTGLPDNASEIAKAAKELDTYFSGCNVPDFSSHTLDDQKADLSNNE